MIDILATPAIDSAVVFHRRFSIVILAGVIAAIPTWTELPGVWNSGGHLIVVIGASAYLTFWWCITVRPEAWVTENAVLIRNPYRSYVIPIDEVERVYQGVWGVATIRWPRRRWPIRVFVVQTTNLRRMLRKRSCVNDFIETIEGIQARHDQHV